MLDDARELRDPRRLQPEQDARAFHHRRLSPRIRAHDEIHPGRKLRLEPLEAPEVAEFEEDEHRGT
jgi:hypothetical protein